MVLAFSSRGVLGVGAGLAALFLSVACGNEEQVKRVQKAADERVARAEKTAAERVAAAQKEIEALKAQFAEASAKAKAEADHALETAKAGAEEQAKEAEAAITKAREAYKAEGRARLKDINEDLKDLSQRTARAPEKVRAAALKALQEIQKKEVDISKDIAAFDQATLDTFRAARAKLEQDLARLKAQIQATRAKLP